MNYLPIAPPFFIALFVFFTLIVLLIELRVVQFVYESVGVNPRLLLSLLLLSFLGSYINIGITQLPPERIYAHGIVDFYGMPYVVPMVTEAPGTVIAVNVGGAIVPTLLSLYLIVKNRLYTESLIAIAIVSAVVSYVLKRREIRFNLDVEYEYEQRKKLRNLIGSYHGRALQAANRLNQRFWNLYAYVGKGWLNVNSDY